MPQQGRKIAELVHGFATHIKALKSPETKEATIRQNYIDPFWRALGWDVGDTQQLGPSEAEVIIEKTVETVDSSGLRFRRPDYLFRLGGFSRFIVEAKKPSVDIDTDLEAIFQAKQYAWNSPIPFAILTDFEKFRVYDTTLSPILHDPRRGLISEFSLDYDSYESQWDILLNTFGRAAVEGGSLERLLAQIKNVRSGRRIRTVDRMLFDIRGTEPVDKAFLSYLDAHRRHLAHEIYSNNKATFPEADTIHGAAKLTEAVQRIMDRLVFMRVIEDRGIVPYGALRKMLERVGTEGGEFYEALCGTFREYDSKYNGYLYKPSFCEQLTIEGNVLADFVRTLYPPDGPWDFAAIGDDILGVVYERFLGNVVTVKHAQAVIEEKPEVRHAGGIYYTLRFVVDSIIRRVVGPKIEGKTPIEVLDVKVLDLACGSGSFLVAALQYLFDYCLSAVTKDPSLAKATVPSKGGSGKGRKKKSEIAFQDRDGRWYLAPDFRAALLTQCIYGVDIDRQAVEVTVMSLYLKMLESKLPENWATLWVERELLPTLDNNIRCGNSLIDSAAYFAFQEKSARNQMMLAFEETEDTRFRINRFDWMSDTHGFGRLLGAQNAKDKSHGGFDCIIGNPPYIRVQELNKWEPEECAFYRWKYESAAKGNYDIYVVFAEKALSLLAPDGQLGFIMPHKWWQAQYGEGFRARVAKGKNLQSIVDFTHNSVFPGASTYTAIQCMSKKPNESNSIPITRINTLTDGPSQLVAAERGRDVEGVERFTAEHPKDASPWAFLPPAQTQTIAKLGESSEITLADVASRMAQGIRTGMNQVFVLKCIDQKHCRYYSEQLQQEVTLEADLLLPFLGAEHMRRYQIAPSSQIVLMPYGTSGEDSGQLLPQQTIQSNYPATWSYLTSCEKVLRQREKGLMDCEGWYGYTRVQNIDVMCLPKILVPDMMEKPAFSFDAKGKFAFVSGYAITLKAEYSEHNLLLLGMLNSKALGDFLKGISTPLRGGWYRSFPQFMKRIPIKLPKTSGEKKFAERIKESVTAIMEAKIDLRSPSLSDGEKTRLESAIEGHEQRIDEMVFRLYGIDER